MDYKIYLIKQDGVPCYVGQTKLSLRQRFLAHCNGKRCTMYKPIHCIGKEHFEILPIDHAHTKDESSNKEEFWTVFYQKDFVLYNKNIGYIPNDETRIKFSEAKKGNHLSEETRKKISETQKGKHHTEEARKKISEANKGKRLSEETKRKLSETKKGKYAGEKHPMYGKHHTEETRKKLSEAEKKYTVQCIETGIIYPSMLEAQRQTNIPNGNIRRACIKNICAGGYHWKFVNAA